MRPLSPLRLSARVRYDPPMRARTLLAVVFGAVGCNDAVEAIDDTSTGETTATTSTTVSQPTSTGADTSSSTSTTSTASTSSDATSGDATSSDATSSDATSTGGPVTDPSSSSSSTTDSTTSSTSDDASTSESSSSTGEQPDPPNEPYEIFFSTTDIGGLAPNRIRTIWGSAPDDIWFLGRHVIHYDGETYDFHVPPENTSATFDAVYPRAADDIYVASGSRLYHWDGIGWGTAGTCQDCSLQGLWSDDLGPIWAFGSFARIFSFDGEDFTEWPTPSDGSLYGIHGTAQDDIWAVGTNDDILHFDGIAWTDVDVGGGPFDDYSRVFAAAPDDVTIFGNQSHRHFDGVDWSPASLQVGQNVTDIWAGSPSDLWVAGERVQPPDSRIGHFDGVSWTYYVDPAGNRSEAIWSDSEGTVWTGIDSGTVRRFAGGQFGGEDLSLAQIRGAWFNAPDDIWAGGLAGELLHYDGVGWSIEQNVGVGIRGMAGGPSTAWAVTDNGEFLAFDGAQWSFTADVGFPLLYSVDLVDDEIGWATGATGTILQLDDGAWVDAGAGAPVGTLYEVWAASSTAAWAVGDFGTVMQWDGIGWSQIDVGAGDLDLFAISGRDSSDVWIGGEDNSLFHYDGVSWTNEDNGYPLTPDVTEVMVDPDGTVFVLFAAGDTVLRREGGAWDEIDLPSNVSGRVMSPANGDDERWILGTRASRMRFD